MNILSFVFGEFFCWTARVRVLDVTDRQSAHLGSDLSLSLSGQHRFDMSKSQIIEIYELFVKSAVRQRSFGVWHLCCLSRNIGFTPIKRLMLGVVISFVRVGSFDQRYGRKSDGSANVSHKE
ncbi:MULTISPECIES: hypothetical protein [Paraburkholderia]|uniref:hypothetical protein n=1 Tax=Paraburkholderia TaxID=1822464 RepID=UPI00224E52F5|nr:MULTISPECIES: hypothetical protein [Paraburkholderia]MCX4176503.1 hypothetical protein [Paraburkholderia madseniana]MDQ6464495.1 hypothetical protein [Paraburkholderia madseniana]